MFEVKGTKNSFKEVFFSEQFKKYGDVGKAVSDDIRKIYFGCIPSIEAEVQKKKREVVFTQDFEEGKIEKDIDLLHMNSELVNLDGRIRGYNPYYRELDSFCRSIIEDKPFLQTGIDGKKAIEVINAVYVSSAERTNVTLPLDKEIDLKKVFLSSKKNKIRVSGKAVKRVALVELEKKSSSVDHAPASHQK